MHFSLFITDKAGIERVVKITIEIQNNIEVITANFPFIPLFVVLGYTSLKRLMKQIR